MSYNTSTRQTKENTELFQQIWQPDGDIKAVICLIHGLGEHSSRYKHVAEYYQSKGYVVAAFDLRGHGKSQGQRGHYASLEMALDDIKVFIDSTIATISRKTSFSVWSQSGWCNGSQLCSENQEQPDRCDCDQPRFSHR